MLYVVSSQDRKTDQKQVLFIFQDAEMRRCPQHDPVQSQCCVTRRKLYFFNQTVMRKNKQFFYLFVDSGKDILESVLCLQAHGFNKACCPGMVVVACKKNNIM